MARRGRKRVVEREALYWQMLAQGVGTVEACRQIGIGRKTGYRWRAELGGIRPPTRPMTVAASSGRYLSRFDRQRIATLDAQGIVDTGDRPTDRPGAALNGQSRATSQPRRRRDGLRRRPRLARCAEHSGVGATS